MSRLHRFNLRRRFVRMAQPSFGIRWQSRSDPGRKSIAKLSLTAKESGPFNNGAAPGRQCVSIVIPVFNEAANLGALWARLKPVIDDPRNEWELIFVDDGSSDRSLEILREFSKRDPRVHVIELARNFGQHSALLAGFRNSSSDVVVKLDAD